MGEDKASLRFALTLEDIKEAILEGWEGGEGWGSSGASAPFGALEPGRVSTSLLGETGRGAA